MKRGVFAGALLGFLFTCSVFALPVTEIQYEAADLGAGRWQYSYAITNISLPVPIEEFAIWFDFDLYDDLSIETPDPPASAWDEIVIQSEPIIEDDGYYDTLTLGVGVEEGQTVSGFAVSFDWLGMGQPGPQFYEIVNPTTFVTIYSCYTVPEPGTLLPVGLGGLYLRRRTARPRLKRKYK